MTEYLSDSGADLAHWPPVPQIETSTPVLGGPGGPVNVPHQALADRTNALKTAVQALQGQVQADGASLEDIYAKAKALQSEADRLGKEVADIWAALSAIKVPEPGEPIDLSGVIAAIASVKAQLDGLALPDLGDFATQAQTEARARTDLMVSPAGLKNFALKSEIGQGGSGGGFGGEIFSFSAFCS
jgi:hypothetical protein